MSFLKLFQSNKMHLKLKKNNMKEIFRVERRKEIYTRKEKT